MFSLNPKIEPPELPIPPWTCEPLAAGGPPPFRSVFLVLEPFSLGLETLWHEVARTDRLDVAMSFHSAEPERRVICSALVANRFQVQPHQ